MKYRKALGLNRAFGARFRLLEDAGFDSVRQLASTAGELDNEIVLRNEQTCPEQIEILRGMTLEQRWRAAQRLYWTVRRHKAAFLRSQHPDCPMEKIESEVGRIFLHAGT